MDLPADSGYVPSCGLDLLVMTEGSGEKFCIERGWNVAEGAFGL